MWLLFRMEREYSCWISDIPLVSGDCVVSQEGSWALKSPMTRVSSVELKRESKSGRYPDGQEEDGGI